MQKSKLFFALFLCLLLSACNAFSQGQGVEDLLRAPQPTAQLRDIQTALNAFAQTSVQFKYPRGEKELSPVILRDLDSDGISEAVVLYTKTDESQNVFLAILENLGENWDVAQEVQGVSSEVTDIELVNFNDNTQIIVGYSNSSFTDEYLSVYEYKNESITRLYEQSYQHYLAQDINNDGIVDFLVIAKDEETNTLNLNWMLANNNSFSVMQTITLDERYVSFDEIKYANSSSNMGIILQGTFASGWISNTVYRVQPEELKLEIWPQSNYDIALLSLRSSENLTTTAFGANNTLYIPTSVTLINAGFENNRFYYINWRDYLGNINIPVLQYKSEENVLPQSIPNANISQNELLTLGQSYTVALPEEIIFKDEELKFIEIPTRPIFGVYDSLQGYFATFPDEWMGKITVTDSASPGEWHVRDKNTNNLLVSIKISPENSLTGNYTLAADIGENNLFVLFGSNCTEQERQIIRNGFLIF